MESGPRWLSPERYVAQSDEAGRRFGRMIRCWRVRNGWTQYVIQYWSK